MSIHRNLFILAALSFSVVLGLGCPRARDGGDEPMLTFSAAGELMPTIEGGVPLFNSRKSSEAMPDLMPFLVERDLVLADFTGGVDLGCQPLLRDTLYRWEPGWLALLSETNIEVLNLANDHALDCGREALSQAMNQMLGQGFYITGAGRTQLEAHSPAYLTRNGVTISLVSFLLEPPPGIDPCDNCTGPSRYDRQALINALKEMKQRASHRIVILHRAEGRGPALTEPEMNIVREAMDFGADLVICYGPEKAGGIHRIRGNWAIGSMGRLAGDEPAGDGIDGFILSAEFKPDRMMNLRLLGVDLVEGRPRLLRGDEGADALGKVQAFADQDARGNSTIIGDILYLK